MTWGIPASVFQNIHVAQSFLGIAAGFRPPLFTERSSLASPA
jgi:hypothetical protein